MKSSFDQRLFSEKYIGEAVVDCDRIPSGDHRFLSRCSWGIGFLIPLTSHGKQDTSLGGIRINVCLQRCCKCTCPSAQDCNPCYQILPNLPISMCPVLQCALVDPPAETLLRNNMNLIRSSSSRSFCCMCVWLTWVLDHKNEYPRGQPLHRAKPLFPFPGEAVGKNVSMSVKCYPIRPPSSSRNWDLLVLLIFSLVVVCNCYMFVGEKPDSRFWGQKTDFLFVYLCDFYFSTLVISSTNAKICYKYFKTIFAISLCNKYEIEIMA